MIKSWLIRHLDKFKVCLLNEKEETKEMIAIYNKHMSGIATKEEIKIANEQAKDVLRTIGLTGLIILPGTFFILPAIVKLGDKLGITVLPSSFVDKDKDEK